MSAKQDAIASNRDSLLLTAEETASELRVAPSTLWAMIKSGEIETIVIGEKMRRVPRQALVDYIAAKREETKNTQAKTPLGKIGGA